MTCLVELRAPARARGGGESESSYDEILEEHFDRMT
jgi:hypothetical protein